jgi:hypothetical protein
VTRPDRTEEGARGREARRLLNGLRGSDKSGGDRAPAVQARNAGLNSREEDALDHENGRPFGLNMTASAIADRVNGDPAAARDEYLKRH